MNIFNYKLKKKKNYAIGSDFLEIFVGVVER